jgi:Ca-activated chloride channel family protein
MQPSSLATILALSLALAPLSPARAQSAAAPAAMLETLDPVSARLETRTPQGEPGTISLIDERVTVAIDQQFAQTTLRQAYRSDATERLEGRYVLTAGDGARVHGFAYWNGEQKIVGAVYEKETAARIYEEVTGLGRDPGLLEQVGEGAFSFRIFPIEPGETKPVEIEVGQWLRRRGDTVEYRVPVGLAGATIAVDIRDRRRIGKVSSPTHRLAVSRAEDGRVTVQARGPAAQDTSSGELILRYTLVDEPWTLAAVVHRDAGHDGYLVVTLATPDDLPRAAATAKDVTLVLDRSGSMAGEPLHHAKLAAADVVRRLGAEDRVNVVVFDDAVDTMFDRPRPVTEEVRAETLAFIERIQDGGGTNIALALERALAAQLADDHPDILLFLTDGQSDAQQALAVAGRDQGDARVFTIGVGGGVEKPLLARLAADKRGRFTFIDAASAIGPRMGELYGQIEEPLLVDVALEVEGARLARAYPRSLPDLFRHDELRVTSRIEGQGPVDITLRGMLAGKPVAFQTRVDLPEQSTRPWVGRLWAQSRVEDLLAEIALAGETDELKTEVTELALAYDFASPYTSFLAIPESELTEAAVDALESARDRKRRVLAAHKDAAALSRAAMPPGDPVLTVRAPSDAQQVTAYFPFGLVKDLTYDAASERWQTRFLVPKHVADGAYDVKIVIVKADGTVEIATISYTIDSAEPDFEVELEATEDGVRIVVTTLEGARAVTVAALGPAGAIGLRADLSEAGSSQRFAGWLALPPGIHELRVVVADEARNESDRVVTVEIADGALGRVGSF